MFTVYFTLEKEILHGSALAVSDWSYYPVGGVRACVWIIATADGKEWVSGGWVGGGLFQDYQTSKTVIEQS